MVFFFLKKHSGHEGHRRDRILDKQLKLTVFEEVKYKNNQNGGL